MRKVNIVLILLITVLSVFVNVVGIFSSYGPGQYEFESLRSGTISIYGRGIYQYEIESFGSQTRAQDLVTMLFCVPLLLISTIKSAKNSLSWRLLQTGAIGYFTYTYLMFSLIAYNRLFLLYIGIFVLSFYAFISSLLSYNKTEIAKGFEGVRYRKLIAGYLFFSGFGLGVRWLSDLVPAAISNTVPSELYHYTTPLVYALDLALVVPAFFVVGYLFLKNTHIGNLMTAVLIVKAVTMWVALTAMTAAIILDGETLDLTSVLMAPVFAVFSLLLLSLLLNETKRKVATSGVH